MVDSTNEFRDRDPSLNIIGLTDPTNNQIIGLPNPFSNPTQNEKNCNLLYHYDNEQTSSTACNLKVFCGVYMYQGLKTFQSYGNCVSSWNATHPFDKITFQPYPYPPKPDPTNGQILILTNDGQTHRVFAPTNKEGDLNVGNNNSYTTCTVETGIAITLTRHDSNYYANGFKMIRRNNGIYYMNENTQTLTNAPIATKDIKKAICKTK